MPAGNQKIKIAPRKEFMMFDLETPPNLGTVQAHSAFGIGSPRLAHRSPTCANPEHIGL